MKRRFGRRRNPAEGSEQGRPRQRLPQQQIQLMAGLRRQHAAALSLPLDAVGIAAGTNEHLGYVGEEKGITCFAMVLLR